MRLLPLLAVLLGTLTALAAPVPKSVKRDPLLGEWVIESGAPPCATGYDTLRVGNGWLRFEGAGVPDTRSMPYEIDDEPGGERLLTIDRERRRRVLVLAGDTLTIRDREGGPPFVLRRGR